MRRTFLVLGIMTSELYSLIARLNHFAVQCFLLCLVRCYHSCNMNVCLKKGPILYIKPSKLVFSHISGVALGHSHSHINAETLNMELRRVP